LLIDYDHSTQLSFRSAWRNTYGYLLQIKPNETNDYYLRIRNVVRAESSLQSITLSSLAARVERHGAQLSYFLLFSGAFFSIIAFLFIFAVVQYVQNRDLAFGYYALYLLLCGLYYWWKFEKSNSFINLIFTNYPDWYYSIEVPLWGSIYMSYMLFLVYFINTKDNLPRLHRFLRFSISMMGIYLILDRLLIAFGSFSFAWDCFYWMRITVTIINMVVIYFVFSLNKKLKYYVLWGTLLMLLGGAITGYMSGTMQVHYQGPWDIPLLPVQIGTIIEICFLFVGLGYKSRLAEREKTQIYESLKRQEQKALELKNRKDFLNRWYTNISHEFRTPLTVIEGMAAGIHGNVEAKSLIQHNSQQLLNLVNQMLDLAKLETSSLSINWVQGDVVRFLRYLVSSYRSYALQQQLTLSFYSHQEEILLDYDSDKLERIITNLLQNAIQHTPAYGEVKLSTQIIDYQSNTTLLLKVEDTGKGILAADLPHIFDRFYQTQQQKNSGGTGIGLALVNELVQLLGGQIKVKSELKKGSCFSIYLPIHQDAELQQTLQPLHLVDPVETSTIVKKSSVNSPDNSTEKPLLLIVEDNRDVARYLKSLVIHDYQLLFAQNGHLGIELALEHIPDIIISDVMMPEKDGLELIEILKKDRRTSHIPIILLTAKATIEDRLAGLATGADAYLAKPFQPRELLIRLEQLLMNQKRLQAHFSPHQSTKSTSQEALFVQQLNQLIEANLHNPNWSIPQLCQQMTMSKTQLYRKVKALTGKSVALYIRYIRLCNAKEILHNTDLPINQVAIQVGISDLSYFSRIYKQEFGHSPSEEL
ncbi:MAG: ATP-binding protein, partial [Saprospiraceae bacterium]